MLEILYSSTVTVVDLGEGPPHLFLDQTEARRTKKNFWTLPRLISGSEWPSFLSFNALASHALQWTLLGVRRVITHLRNY